MFINCLWFIEQAWKTVFKPFTQKICEVICIFTNYLWKTGSWKRDVSFFAEFCTYFPKARGKDAALCAFLGPFKLQSQCKALKRLANACFYLILLDNRCPKGRHRALLHFMCQHVPFLLNVNAYWREKSIEIDRQEDRQSSLLPVDVMCHLLPFGGYVSFTAS